MLILYSLYSQHLQYVMVSLTTDKQMMFGGTEEPCAYGELISSELMAAQLICAWCGWPRCMVFWGGGLRQW